jgi:hypothetical protein
MSVTEPRSTRVHAGNISPYSFSRIWSKEPETKIDDAVLQHLAQEMVAASAVPSPDSEIPAGYTYLGQFIAHDMSFSQRPQSGAPGPLTQGRSPALDLDSLYGEGPTKTPELYDQDKVRLKLGSTAANGGIADKHGFDLPRRGGGADLKKSKRQQALIADRRNDDNLLLAQMHLVFARFHNRVVSELAEKGLPAAKQWEQAREIVIKHYQWMITTDFLPRILDDEVRKDVWDHGRKYFEKDAGAAAPATMPEEFAFAAFRIGHSMVRESYDLNRFFRKGTETAAKLEFLLRFSGLSGNLSEDGVSDDHDSGTFDRLPSNWIVDWRRFFDFEKAGINGLKPPQPINVAKRIDTRLARPLFLMPLGSLLTPAGGRVSSIERNLAYRTLRNGATQRLSTGQQMAKHFQEAPINAEMLIAGKDGVVADDVLLNTQLFKETPLWFYILREAEINDGRLGKVGSRIVAETFHRAIEGSRVSIFTDSTWRPSLGPNPGRFTMADLLFYAFEGDPALLNPLGDG